MSPATVSRHLSRARLVTPDPRKRPRSSISGSRPSLPSECWQAGFTHYPLAGGAVTEILTWPDDHSRLALSVTAHARVTGPVVLAGFRAAVAAYGPPAPALTDNGMVFTTRFSGGKGGRNGLETELRRPGATQKNGRPNHPQTQGKAGRFQQTLKKWLRAQLAQPADLPSSRPSPAHSRTSTTSRRPHRSLPRRPAPAVAYQARPKAAPGSRDADTHDRVRTDRVHAAGTVTLRTGGRLHHLGVGRTYAGTSVLLIVQDLQIRIIHAAAGELLRQLTLDPARDYQPTGAPKGPTRKRPAQDR